MAFNSDDFIIVDDGWAFRLLHKDTKKNFGEYFQAQCRSLEWKAASIVYDKYRRKNDLGHEDLVSLRKFAENFAEQRREAGKPINQDHLVQVVSAELKKRIAEKPKEDLIELRDRLVEEAKSLNFKPLIIPPEEGGFGC